MRPAIAIPLAVFLLLLLVTPMNTGETIANISFAMFYNRIGWALLGLLLVMHLPLRRPVRWQVARDATAATVLTLLMAYTKMTYGVVAGMFLLLMLLRRDQRPWAAATLVACLVISLLVELAWGATRMHIADLAVAAQVSGVISPLTYLRSVLTTQGEYAIFLFVAGLALWFRPSLSDLLFYGFCVAAGFALLNQNFQVEGIITLLVGTAVAAETLARGHIPDEPGPAGPLPGAPLCLPVSCCCPSAYRRPGL